MTPLDNEGFAIAFVIAKRCFNGRFSFDDDQFPASGTDFSLDDDFKTADRWL